MLHRPSTHFGKHSTDSMHSMSTDDNEEVVQVQKFVYAHIPKIGT